MSESENALPLDNSFWEHCEHLNFTIGLPVSETRMMDILQVLKDIYFTIDEDVLEAQKLIITMAAILVASKDGKADKIWEELSVQEAMKNVDSHIKDILNEG